MNEQGTAEWKLERCGKFTASRFSDVLARNKKSGEPLKAYHDLIWDIVVERMTGEPIDGPDGFALRWGSEVEPFARESYELTTGNVVMQTGFIVHPEHSFIGASPDGVIGNDGGLEMKCPKNSAVHLERFISGVPAEYIPQIQGCMMVTGRTWWDFVSYDPRMPESHRMLKIRIERNDKYINALLTEILEAESLARELMDKIKLKAI